ncbi:MAG: tetratricopeptide repeat protein [Chloroherpetonaceae bacterium]|nr:tetratricopeptide repeat protein [Chloroherpetonaceae bacterium]
MASRILFENLQALNSTSLCRSSLLIILLFLFSCGSTKEVSEVKNIQTEADETFTERNREKALQLFVSGALFDAKEQYSQAVLEYQDALRFAPDEPAIYFALAKSYRALSKFEQAQAHINKAIQFDPSQKWYYELAGQIAFEHQEFARAAEFFESFSKKDPSNSNALYMLAAAYTADEKYEMALEVYDQYILTFGLELDVLYKKLLLQVQIKRLPEAIITVQEMRMMDPDNEELLYTQGDLLTKLSRFDEAITIFKELLAKNPKDVRAMVSLSETFIQRKDWKNFEELVQTMFSNRELNQEDKLNIGQLYLERAAKDSTMLKPAEIVITRLQKDFPKEWKPFWFLGVVFMENHKYDKAIDQFKQLIVLNPLWQPGWENLGIAYLSNNDAQNAIKTFQSALKKLTSSGSRLRALLGLSYSQASQDDETVQTIEEVVNRPVDLDEPMLFQCYTVLGMTYDKLRRYPESEKYYEEALKLRPEDALVLNNLAYSLSERDQQLERALEMAKIAVEKDSTNGAYLDTYGWVYYKLGRYKEALVWIDKAVKAGRESAAVLEHLGDVYYKLGDKVKALENWKKAFSLNQSNKALENKLNALKMSP